MCSLRRLNAVKVCAREGRQRLQGAEELKETTVGKTVVGVFRPEVQLAHLTSVSEGELGYLLLSAVPTSAEGLFDCGVCDY